MSLGKLKLAQQYPPIIFCNCSLLEPIPIHFKVAFDFTKLYLSHPLHNLQSHFHTIINYIQKFTYIFKVILVVIFRLFFILCLGRSLTKLLIWVLATCCNLSFLVRIILIRWRLWYRAFLCLLINCILLTDRSHGYSLLVLLLLRWIFPYILLPLFFIHLKIVSKKVTVSWLRTLT